MPQSDALLVNEQRLNLASTSLKIDRTDLRLLLERLQERVMGSIDFAMGQPPLSGQPEAERTAARQQLTEGYTFFITLVGTNGSNLNGTVPEIFNSPNFPADITTVFVDSAMKLRKRNYEPLTSLALFIDFRRPAIFDFNFMPSRSTENGSYFSTRGLDPTWVRGVYHEVESFVREHQVSARWLHRHSVYDVLLFLIGFPFAFWVAYRCSPLAQKISGSEFLRAGFY